MTVGVYGIVPSQWGNVQWGKAPVADPALPLSVILTNSPTQSVTAVTSSVQVTESNKPSQVSVSLGVGQIVPTNQPSQVSALVTAGQVTAANTPSSVISAFAGGQVVASNKPVLVTGTVSLSSVNANNMHPTAKPS